MPPCSENSLRSRPFPSLPSFPSLPLSFPFPSFPSLPWRKDKPLMPIRTRIRTAKHPNLALLGTFIHQLVQEVAVLVSNSPKLKVLPLFHPPFHKPWCKNGIWKWGTPKFHGLSSSSSFTWSFTGYFPVLPRLMSWITQSMTSRSRPCARTSLLRGTCGSTWSKRGGICSIQKTIVYMGGSIRDPQNGWLIRGNPIKMDDLGAPPFMEILI